MTGRSSGADRHSRRPPAGLGLGNASGNSTREPGASLSASASPAASRLLLVVDSAWAPSAWARRRSPTVPEFKKFVNAFVRIPAQLVNAGRRLVFRLLAWKPLPAHILTCGGGSRTAAALLTLPRGKNRARGPVRGAVSGRKETSLKKRSRKPRGRPSGGRAGEVPPLRSVGSWPSSPLSHSLV